MENPHTSVEPVTAPIKLFYATPVLLGDGSIILPGNWARMLRRYGDSDNFFVPFRELVFEEIRRAEFPDAVSRLRCVFCCETEEGIRQFLRETGRVKDEMYEASTLNPRQRVFRANWNIVQGLQGARIWEQVEAMARRYWSTAPGDHVEVLSESPIKIIRHIPA